MSIRLLAARLKLAPSTVSMALRGHPRVSAATRERVQAAAAAAGYTVNPLLSRLLTRARRRRAPKNLLEVAVIHRARAHLNFRRLPFSAELRRRLLDALLANGLSPTEFDVGLPEHAGPRLDRILKARGIGAVLTLPDPESRLPLELDWSAYVLLVMGHSLPELAADRIVTDLGQAFGEAFTRLRANGFQRPGLCLPVSPAHHAAPVAVAAYHRDCFAHRIENAPPVFVAHPWDQARVAAWIERHGIDAIATNHVDGALSLRRARAEQGRELGLVLVSAPASPEGVAAMRFDAAGTAKAAANAMAQLLHEGRRGPRELPFTLCLPARWFDGPSAHRATV